MMFLTLYIYIEHKFFFFSFWVQEELGSVIGWMRDNSQNNGLFWIFLS